jgi:hypothetical protein
MPVGGYPLDVRYGSEGDMSGRYADVRKRDPEPDIESRRCDVGEVPFADIKGAGCELESSVN